eukprot:TRINITY_DN2609_c0_g1_i1.p1 TRINITY_DN2609_c0_g1~~TRINITY_DN2609_c0_g1_i1.p1  ORF type:complete len:815 (+),score=265.07 TRINITY_DN2609_c0_g1_i1:285-2729(+)
MSDDGVDSGADRASGSSPVLAGEAAPPPVTEGAEDADGWCAALGRWGDTVGSGTVGFLTGFLGAMGGVGGGPFCVPLLGALLGLSQKRCIGTSILCGLTTLTVGGITTFLFSALSGKRMEIPIAPIAIIAVIAPSFGFMSAKMTKTMSQTTLRLIFAWFLLFCSGQILYKLVYSPTGVEGHWEYDLVKAGSPARRGLVYEIERVEDGMMFRTQHFHARLEPAAVLAGRPVQSRGRDLGGLATPVGFEEGWSAPLINQKNGGQRGTIWIRVLDRGSSLETVFHSRFPKPHWNGRVTARRKKGVLAQAMTDFVMDWRGSLLFHMLLAVIAGTASGLLGIAGGSVVVPLMSITGAFPFQSITATSLLSMIPTSAVTCLTHYREGNVVLRHAPGLVLGTATGAMAGTRLMSITSEVVRKSACAGVLLFTSAIMMFQGSKQWFSGRDRVALVRLAGGCVLFFCLSALLQEKVFNLPEFSHEFLLTFMQSTVIGALAFTDLRRERREAGVGKGSPARAPCVDPPKCPVLVYMAVAALSSTSLLLTNRASKLLDYTTQVVFKSSKLPWIMIWRLVFLKWKRRPTLAEWLWAMVLSSGLAIFTFAGASFRSDLGEAFWHGLLSILVALSCDATMYTIEEGVVFGRYKADKHELIFYMQAFSIPTTFIFFVLSGHVPSSVSYLQAEWRFPTLIVGAAACTYMGTRCLMQIVQEFDASMAVATTLLRKVATVLLSFVFFPKLFSAFHVLGGTLVVVGAYGLMRTTRHDDRDASSPTLEAAKEGDPGPHHHGDTPLHHSVVLLSPSMRVSSVDPALVGQPHHPVN